MNIQSKSLRGWQLFSLIAVLVTAMSATAIAIQPDLVDGLRSAIRATARSSFVLFLIAFTASAFAVLVPSPLSKALVRERRFIGLAFAFSHLMHAVVVYVYALVDTEFRQSATVANNIPGTIGYVFILLLALTSFKSSARLLGPKAWKKLHVTGMWVIAAVFIYAYFTDISKSAWYVLPFGLICGAVAVRLVGKLAIANKRNQTKQTPSRQAAIAS
jgi:DMSO/TMAO reductase YedYZ heme-binding membrane subunit